MFSYHYSFPPHFLLLPAQVCSQLLEPHANNPNRSNISLSEYFRNFCEITTNSALGGRELLLTRRKRMCRKTALSPRQHIALLYCTVLQCTAIHYTALHCTALHCTALYVPSSGGGALLWTEEYNGVRGVQSEQLHQNCAVECLALAVQHPSIFPPSHTSALVQIKKERKPLFDLC